MRHLSTYKQYFVAILSILLLLPCALKRDIKINLGVATPSSIPQEKAKIACSFFAQEHAPQVIQCGFKNSNRFWSALTDRHSFVQYSSYNYLLDIVSYIHQKIPARIRYQQFLI